MLIASQTEKNPHVCQSKVVNHSWSINVSTGHVESNLIWQNWRCWQEIL